MRLASREVQVVRAPGADKSAPYEYHLIAPGPHVLSELGTSENRRPGTVSHLKSDCFFRRCHRVVPVDPRNKARAISAGQTASHS
jgi:hypothetical protein